MAFPPGFQRCVHGASEHRIIFGRNVRHVQVKHRIAPKQQPLGDETLATHTDGHTALSIYFTNLALVTLLV